MRKIETTYNKSPEERFEIGLGLRKKVPINLHGEWSPGNNRKDPVKIIEAQNIGRLEKLVPVRRARMSVSPFTFYRGAAAIMASDLSNTQNSGLKAQICGDAHIANFGGYASPERQFVLDINDFDETLAGPWEWDLKRLTVSFYIAGIHNGLSIKVSKELAKLTCQSYRNAMREFADSRVIDNWYSLMKADEMKELAKGHVSGKKADKEINKAKTKDHLQVLSKLAEIVDGKYRIKSDPPLLVPARDLTTKMEREELREEILINYKQYLDNLPDHIKHLLSNYSPVDFAMKIVGVGSVGTRCSIMLLQGRDNKDPLFLQIKQANNSVLEEHLDPCVYNNSGQRVVEGQRLIQTVSDVFLGWNESKTTGRHYYWRQLKDWKASLDVDSINKSSLKYAAKIRGKVLANGHARTGDPISISAYMGEDSKFDKAIASFSENYALQNEMDYQLFLEKINNGQLEISNEF